MVFPFFFSVMFSPLALDQMLAERYRGSLRTHAAFWRTNIHSKWTNTSLCMNHMMMFNVLLDLYVCLWPFMYEKSHSHVKAKQYKHWIIKLGVLVMLQVSLKEQDPVETLGDKLHHACPIKEIQMHSHLWPWLCLADIPPENRGNHLHFYQLHDSQISTSGSRITRFIYFSPVFKITSYLHFCITKPNIL